MASKCRQHTEIGLVLVLCLLVVLAVGSANQPPQSFDRSLGLSGVSIDAGPLVSLTDAPDTDETEDCPDQPLQLIQTWLFALPQPYPGSHEVLCSIATLFPSSGEGVSRFLPRPPPVC